jgi:hypothetical protein
MTDDFAGFPQSVAERRADLADDARLWTPRDVLIACLRALDEGKHKPLAVVICMQIEGDKPGSVGTKFWQAGPNCHTNLGLLERVKTLMQVEST